MNTKLKVLAAIDSLNEILAELDEVEVNVDAPTLEEISMNLWGNPLFHIERPDDFAKIAKFYNPNKQPFTDTTIVMTGRLGYGKTMDADGYLRDPRPRKVIEKDGKLFQGIYAQAGPDWYWIGNGVSNVADAMWNVLEINQDTPADQELENIRKYKGGLRGSVNSWPPTYLAAWNETH